MRVSEIQRRVLMGPGPSDVHPRVLQAMAHSTIGHLDPQCIQLLDEIRAMLQQVFRTENQLTLAVSGTGSAGMETAVVNLIEPGDRMLVCSAGVFGERMRDVASRAGAEVEAIEVPWGQVFSPDDIRTALRERGPFKVVGIVHAETSTGAAQPLEDLGAIVHAAGALLLVDAVTSLGGMPVLVDEWGIDACYSGTQKCLSCPPGLAPITFSARAVEAMSTRQTPVQSWYLDMNMVRRYWGSERLYHHTAPINMLYGLHEALSLVIEEGVETRWARHAREHLRLKAGLEALGLRYLADPAHQLPMLNAVATPEGCDEGILRRQLLVEYGIEIGGGLGAHKGKAWRIGLMGESATEANVQRLLAALEALLEMP